MASPTPNLEELRSDILDPEKGYVLLRGFHSEESVKKYRDECDQFLLDGPKLHTRVNSPTIFDYVHPRSVDSDGSILTPEQIGKVPSTYRIYQFFHNKHSRNTDQLLSKTIQLRNKIEAAWLGDDSYRAEQDRLQSYVIVTKYVYDKCGLPAHQDYSGNAKHPLLQCLVMLSQPGNDYEGGEFTLHTQSGSKVGLQRDLCIEMGDALFFDKSLFHEVSSSQKSPCQDSAGRWTVLVGARAQYRVRSDLYYRLRFSPFFIERVLPIKNRLSQIMGIGARAVRE